MLWMKHYCNHYVQLKESLLCQSGKLLNLGLESFWLIWDCILLFRYQLYGVIMHLGATMASGHYVTYVCSRDTALDCATCTRDKRKTASLSGGAGKPPPNSIIDKQNSLLRCVRSFQTFTNIYIQRSQLSGDKSNCYKI